MPLRIDFIKAKIARKTLIDFFKIHDWIDFMKNWVSKMTINDWINWVKSKSIFRKIHD
jgi:hypothetical protein